MHGPAMKCVVFDYLFAVLTVPLPVCFSLFQQIVVTAPAFLALNVL
jgi:hypothetical protein